MIVPEKIGKGKTKHSWITFFNEETANVLNNYLKTRENEDPRLIPLGRDGCNKVFRALSKKVGLKITPQVLRNLFCNEMGKLGVPDRYVDAFCGRVSKSVLARRQS